MACADDLHHDFELFGVPAQALRRTRAHSTRAGKNCSARPTPTALRRRARRRSVWPCSGRCASTRPTSGSKTRSSARPTCANCAARPSGREQHRHAGEFLMQQMEWREALEDAHRLGRRGCVEAELAARRLASHACAYCCAAGRHARPGGRAAGQSPDVHRALCPSTSTSTVRATGTMKPVATAG
jgi:hypothetical protein